MTTFKNSTEYREIKKVCTQLLLIDKKALFQCYVDGMFDYKLIYKNKEYYFTFCFEDENVVNEQEVEWLLNLKTIKYFSFTYTDYKSKKVEITFNINENLN